ncbi:sugar transporter [Grosmannia clavigera kw1407]|uniref:Sugar transporter n=1 Tax=Grosmannia clavigera (strain kw1407 / UAMH 11150) TaxID=655863 RepID=F0XIN9_GROCL|nr:sugar transporter [Grosmannia clavigera kw1407]EFX02525.1 sugar transporter [Grosmannia clavigera kw1407]
MGIVETFLPTNDRYAALILYGMVFSLAFNGYDAGIMTVILADDQFVKYYDVDSTRSGVIATIPWASTGLAQLCIGGPLANAVGRLWALRISIGLGTLIAFWAGYGMSFHTHPFNIAWRVSNVIQIPVGLMFIVVSFWYPESPRWLYEKSPDDPSRCLQTLCKLRMGTPESDHVHQEFRDIVASYEYRKKFNTGYTGIFKSRALRKRLAYGLYATALQQAGGIAALTMYATIFVYIYKSLGWDAGHQALAINGIQSVLQLLIVLVNTFTVDRFGRRRLLIAGFAIQATALLVMSALTTAFPHNDNKPAAIIEVAMLFIVGLTYCWSNGPVPPALASEIFPQEVRDKAFGFSLLGQTACLLAITQPWPRFNREVGGMSYWLLCGLNTLCLISVIYILPETKGVALERMDRIFGDVDAVTAGEEAAQHQGIVKSAPTSQHCEKVGNCTV